ncbi:ATP-binding cassette domain-containing protein [Variovorax sp. N23]|uniref:ATP-binding cassette domain-containing protein n=1 Tax=Variovorax sp. N23 TaxID=2980555 RepID=UPI0021C6B10A|nr:ATP-binding cassette domain-containing protein [Variovorax sp. N23]MCU4119018.1 ATP-binding cassette domain-containing protein [Variovorax sp. N23]
MIGPNGAGKSTLFNLISDAIRASSGTVMFEGRELTGAAPRQMLAAGLARSSRSSTCSSRQLVALVGQPELRRRPVDGAVCSRDRDASGADARGGRTGDVARQPVRAGRLLRRETRGSRDMLESTEVPTCYRPNHVLQGINLRVEAGEVVGLFGRNGVGRPQSSRRLQGGSSPRAAACVSPSRTSLVPRPSRCVGTASAWC